MGLIDYFKPNLKADTSIEQNTTSNNSMMNYYNPPQNDIFKATIPDFLYKPPFGYPRDINVPHLRYIAKTPYIFSVIKTLCDEAAGTEWSVQVREEFSDDEEAKRLAQEATLFLQNPNGNDESFELVQKSLIKDILELDSGVLVKVFNQKGDFTQIFARDSGSFLKNPDIYGYMGNREEFILPDANSDYINISNKEYAQKFSDAAYFQYAWTSGGHPVPFGRREIMYVLHNPNSDSIYGNSPIEILTNTLYMLMYGQQYNLDYYMNGNVPDGIVHLPNADQQTAKSFAQRLLSKFKKIDSLSNERRVGHQYPIWAGEQQPNFVPFSISAKDMQILEQQKWFIKLVWSCFGVTPDEMGFCYSEDTRVLTDNGLKYYWELNEKDKIATILEEDNSIDYITPTDIHTFDVTDRNFHHYKNNCVDTLVSDDHRMYYKTDKVEKYRMSPSNEIDFSRVKFLQGGLKWKGTPIDKIDIPVVEYNNNKDKGREQLTSFEINDWCEFLGYYLSEGSVSRQQAENKHYKIKISQTDEVGVETMNPLLSKLGFKRNDDSWSLYNKSLAIYLHKFGDSNQKYIPSEIKNLPIEQLKILFNALMVGDGHRAEDGTSVRYSTSSKQFAEDVLEIMLKIGYKASIKSRDFKNENWNTTYNVSGNLTQIEPRVDIKNQRTEEKYTGVMWCPSVNNRPFITERNGKMGIHYNTEDSNRATSVSQLEVHKRKAVQPILETLQYYYTTQILTEIDPKGRLRFVYDDYDINREVKRLEIYEKQRNLGIKTSEMIAEEEGIDVDKLRESKRETFRQAREDVSNQSMDSDIESEENDMSEENSDKKVKYNVKEDMSNE